MGKKGTTRIPEAACPHCGHIVSAASTGSAVPGEGDSTICIECAGVLFFRADLTLRKPKDGELMTMLFREPEWAKAIAQMQTRVREASKPKAGA